MHLLRLSSSSPLNSGLITYHLGAYTLSGVQLHGCKSGACVCHCVCIYDTTSIHAHLLYYTVSLWAITNQTYRPYNKLCRYIIA